MLSDVIFLDAINLRRENVKRIAISEDRSRVGLLEIDAHLVIATHENLAGLGRGILHYRGVLDVFDIGCEGVKVLGGFVQHAQDAFEGPICGRLRGARLKSACGARQTKQREEEKR